MITRPIRSSVLVLQGEALTSPMVTVLPTLAISWQDIFCFQKRRVSPQSFGTNATISLSWQHCDNERQTDFGQTQPGGVAFCQKDLHSQICLHFVKNGQIANHNTSP